MPARLPGLLFAAMIATGACTDPVGVRVSDILGTYHATTFVAEGQDILAAGGSLTLTFQGNGLVFGTLYLPESVGGEVTADMTGTWGLVDRTLIVDQTEDTFVRDAVWIWQNGVIEGTCCTASTTITVRLERS